MNSRMQGLLKEYPALSGKKKKEALDELLGFDDAEITAYKEVFGEMQRASLRFLADACRRKNSFKIMKHLVIEDADKLLNISDDKARKLAAVLIGTCAPNECADKLYEALKNEKTRFVRPSIILALGNTDDPSTYLKDYVIEPGEPKHVKEESDALKKALTKVQKETELPVLSLPKTASVTFINKNAVISELNDKKLKYSLRGQKLIDLQTKDLKELRCYDESIFYLGNLKDLKSVSKKLDVIGLNGFCYRTEAAMFPPALRQDTIKRISTGLQKFGYSDNPSAYSFELRVYRNGSIYGVFPEKNRFLYRRKTISASINPVTAASVMQICKSYFKKDADVLDPFCGSATMLIERAYASPFKSLLGIDKSPIAIKAATINRKESGFELSLLKTDILNFSSGAFDEIISNMPFGNRVSGHEQNKKLYRDFTLKLDSLLKKDGIAFLYTQEKRLLRENINKNQKFVIIKEELFESGGLYPTLFIIKRK